MDKEAYDGLIIATVMAGTKKVVAGLRHAASGKYQDYPPGVLELGIALDAVNMLANDVINCIIANKDEKLDDDRALLDWAAAGFATIANRTDDERLKEFALDNFRTIKG